MSPPSALRAVWERSRVEVLAQVDVIAAAVTDALTGSLAEPTRIAAARDAHKLAGSVGTLGFAVASDHARALEHALAPAHGPSPADLPRLAELAVALRRELEDAPAAGPPVAPAPPDGSPTLLIVDDDQQRRRSVRWGRRNRRFGGGIVFELAP